MEDTDQIAFNSLHINLCDCWLTATDQAIRLMEEPLGVVMEDMDFAAFMFSFSYLRLVPLCGFLKCIVAPSGSVEMCT